MKAFEIRASIFISFFCLLYFGSCENNKLYITNEEQKMPRNESLLPTEDNRRGSKQNGKLYLVNGGSPYVGQVMYFSPYNQGQQPNFLYPPSGYQDLPYIFRYANKNNISHQ